MKKILLLLVMICFAAEAQAYDKKSLVERFTNASCVPCAQLNNAWYNTITQSLVNSGSISHLVYNVNWPGPNDPMYLLNSIDNMARRGYYGVNWVPWPIINSVYFDFENQGQSQFINNVNSGNAEYAPFKVVIVQGVISNNLIEVGIKIFRDPTDVTTFGNVKLRVAITEKTVAYTSPPGSNGERDFFSICRKMLPDAGGTTFTIPAPGDSITIALQYVPTTEFLQAVNMDSMRVVAFIQDDVTRQIYQSKMQDVNKNYMATITSSDEYYFGASSETAVYSSYIKNIGLFPDTYNINLDFEGPAGWSITFTTVNGTFNYGQTDAVTLNPGDSTEVQVNVNANLINGYGQTTAQFVSNQGSFGNVDFRFTTFGLDLLVVDDDGNEDYEEYILQELDALNMEFGIVPSELALPNSGNLNTFGILIWNTGITEPGINTDEMNLLKDLLNNGGKLFLNGLDISYQMADPSSPYYTTETAAFFSDYLHSTYILRQHTATITLGIPGDPITNDITTLRLTGGTGANTINPSQDRFANRIEAGDVSASNILHFWLKPEEHPAIKSFHGTDGRIVFTTFGFETISEQDVRLAFASKIIEWLEISTDIREIKLPGVPVSFELSQNYPNPFNPSTLIRFSIPETVPVSIKIYDLVGSEISTLVNQTMQPGTYELTFDAGNLASGVYIFRMIAGEYSFAKKMSVLK